MPSFYFFKKKNVFIKKNTQCLNKIWKKIKFEKKIWIKKISTSHAITTDPDNLIAPIVIDNDSIYLYSMWKLEKKVINFIYQREIYNTKNVKNYIKVINLLFLKYDEQEKKLALFISLMNKTTFITGKPGTGKTTMIAKLIIAFCIIKKKEINVGLSSPTGKSTIKLAYSVQKTLIELKKNKNINSNKITFKYSVKTLHSLLGIKNNFSQPYYHKNHVLKLDLLIIDESSMIDIDMFCKIIDSLSKKTILLFLGDINQLPPIKSGSIFKDVFNYYKNGYTIDLIKNIKNLGPNKLLPLSNLDQNYISNKFVVLKKTHRYEKNSNIDFFSRAILHNDIKIINNIFNKNSNKINFFQINDVVSYQYMIKNITKCYKNYFQSVKNNESPKNILTIFQYHQALCATNISNFGTKILNKVIECYIQKHNFLSMKNLNLFDKEVWYEGKPIIITKNCNVLGIYNGDIGIVLYDKNKKLKIFFLLANFRLKKISCYLVTHYKLAWFISVHRSQGSEYNAVSLIMPIKNIEFITKELIYTAITRSKKEIFIYGKKNIFFKILKYQNTNFSRIY
ncbi:exodeoxyribonuclease V subunit alpha [Buchnera aphidicola]|uniref:Exodeoxyribonuclease V subunit alpha n=1 Tax=Buchnera aphidicola (Anoecia oenotherae) TaxID=1241833 RepID=A0A4D6Y0W0_9GAMM|nr:exodeoxyribonuclease V subunit alpha [Buchnera aphidicola]QCI19471.1 exodeoxyribonuclease V subunit alpha [Buchnera aphidicola (Anoecia oenotherae)]